MSNTLTVKSKYPATKTYSKKGCHCKLITLDAPFIDYTVNPVSLSIIDKVPLNSPH